jgi:hypothetical protein
VKQRSVACTAKVSSIKVSYVSRGLVTACGIVLSAAVLCCCCMEKNRELRVMWRESYSMSQLTNQGSNQQRVRNRQGWPMYVGTARAEITWGQVKKIISEQAFS